MTHSWTVHVVKDPETGDLIMPFPPDLLAQVGWDFGDTLIWEDMHDGRWCLTRKDTSADGNATK